MTIPDRVKNRRGYLRRAYASPPPGVIELARKLLSE
jgi:hypothetical protein